MRREIGASAGILALIALVLHTQHPSSKEVASGGPPAERADRGHKQAPEEPVERREGPWVATRAFFQHGEAPGAAPAATLPCGDEYLRCLIDPDWQSSHRMKNLREFLGVDTKHPDRYDMWSIVATMADPSHTRLPLFFDRQVEAITRALQPSGFDLAGQWMPWSDRFDSSEPDISARRRERKLQREQEQMPGILIFRQFVEGTPLTSDRNSIRQALFVFVVPEMPTNGVNGPAFFAALRMAHALSTNHRTGYLAPTFSGSFESLAALVNRWNSANPAEKIQGTFYSGMASSKIASDAFHEQTKLEFKSGAASSRDSENVFCAVLKKYGIRDTEAAYLMEDETGFSSQHNLNPGKKFNRGKKANRGKKPNPDEKPNPDKKLSGQQDPPACNTPRYVFPRDISHLRNVYQQEAPTGATEGGQASVPGVAFSIKDPNSGEDSVPTFSDAQTPLSQNSVVNSIMEEFRRQRVRLVYIVATNVLDGLFLAQVVHEASPDTRVLTENPDVLFLAAASQTPLTGTLFLSTYPLFFKGDEWLNWDSKDTRDRRILFASPDFQGLHNSTQAVLADIDAIGSDDALKHLRGYSQIAGSQPYRAHPGLWLLTLNRSGFAPIDLFDEEHKGGPDRHSQWFSLGEQAEKARRPTTGAIAFPPPPRGWFVTGLMTSVFALWVCWLTWRANQGKKCWPMWLSLETPKGLYAARLVTTVGGLLALSAAEMILFSPVWLSGFEETMWSGEGLAGVAGLLGSATPLCLALRLWWRKPPRRFRYEAWFNAGLAVAIYLVLVGAWLRCCWPSESPAALFFRFRAIELYSGSSPALPPFLIAIAAVMGSFFYLKRFSRAGFARPILELGAFESLGPSVWQSHRTIATRIMGPAAAKVSACFLKTDDRDPDVRKRRINLRDEARKSLTRYVAPLILLGIMLLLLRPWVYASAVEQPLYNHAMSVLMMALLFSLTVATYDLALIWKEFCRLLGWIDLMPLRPSFRRVARDWPKRPIWALSERFSKESAAVQMLRALHNRRVVLATGGDLQRTLRAGKDVRDFWKSLPSRFASEIAEKRAYSSEVPETLAAAQGAGAGGFSSFRSRGGDGQSPAPPPWPCVRSAESGIDGFLRARRRHEKLCAALMNQFGNDLLPIWRTNVIDDLRSAAREERASPADEEKLKRYCSEFVTLQFTRYVLYVVAQIQGIAWFLSFGFLILILVLNSYSPQAPLLVGRFLAALFLAIGVVVVWVFAGMERNAILSSIARTQPGKLNQEFWLQLIGLGTLPLIGVLSHLFPSVSNFLASWLGSGVESLH